jgi:hypothetical protein
MFDQLETLLMAWAAFLVIATIALWELASCLIDLIFS